MVKNLLVKLLIHLTKSDSIIHANANALSKKIVDDWIIWIDSVFKTEPNKNFELNIKNKQWFGFDVLRTIIYDSLTKQMEETNNEQ